MSSLAQRIDARLVQNFVLEECSDPADVEWGRWRQIKKSSSFGEVYDDELEQTRKSYLSLIPDTVRAVGQVELDLPAYSERAEIRRQIADKIESSVLPLYRPKWLEKYPMRLRTARMSGLFGVRRETGSPIVYWDSKAGLSRICPDDAREEAQRLKRRVMQPLEDAQSRGAQLTYAVFTTPNVEAGKLREGMQAIYRRFRRLLTKRNGDGDLLFPQIKGALCVLEAPLGSRRDWNVHLNVILQTRGFLDWKALRAEWHWNVELRRLPRAPGALGGALAELIKYAVTAVAVKSADHAEASAAPPMLDWAGEELREWLCAFHGFRRTRTYGELYRVKTPDTDGVGPIVWLGRVEHRRGTYHYCVPLLDSIPEDKSGRTTTPLERYRELMRRLTAPPDLVRAIRSARM
jgi:hypothetical protein